jgi:diphthine-ammonia ligase
MKFIALVSGGKDSIYSIVECCRQGHELVACVHLGRPDEEQEESYMYQTAGSEVLTVLVEECLGVPLILHTRRGQSVNTSLVYCQDNDDANDAAAEGKDANITQDEVEDLYQALYKAKQQFPEAAAVSSGAILSTYQRVRIENVCSRLDLKSFSFLWRRATQSDVLTQMLDDGMVAVLVRTAAPPGLVPRRHLNKTIGQLQGLFHSLHDKYQFHVCGEGGEYETLVLDCPIYKKRLVLDEVEIIEEADDEDVGDLRIISCHAEDKPDQESGTGLGAGGELQDNNNGSTSDQRQVSNDELSQDDVATKNDIIRRSSTRVTFLPKVKRLSGGLWHVSEIMSPAAATVVHRDGELSAPSSEADLAVQEALAIFSLLDNTLRRHKCTPKDVLMVHLYLSEISHFAAINAHYRDVFGVLLPPSRSCVAVGKDVLPGGRRVLLDCIVQSGSGQYMRTLSTDTAIIDDPYTKAAHMTHTSRLRQVLHVQSISHWAPVCVGPYSQVNTLRSGLHFLAGQIGLKPASMTLHDTWTRQLQQTWANVARVLDALNGASLENMLSCLVYVADPIYLQESSLSTITSICHQQIETNGGVVPGAIDNLRRQGMDLDGYEDEETMREMVKENEKPPCPILLVSIPEMPLGALIEVEAIAATHEAASCLEIQDSFSRRVCSAIETPGNEVDCSSGWDTGHDFQLDDDKGAVSPEVQFDVMIRSLGNGSAACAIVTAGTSSTSDMDIDIEIVLATMLKHASDAIRYGPSGLGLANVMNVRLYYVATRLDDSGDLSIDNDGVRIRSAFQMAVASQWLAAKHVPATTLVPVQGMKVIRREVKKEDDGCTLFAMQLTVLDPVHMESELWIRHGREEE